MAVVGFNPAQVDATAADYIELITSLPDSSWVLVPRAVSGTGKTIYEKVTVATLKAAIRDYDVPAEHRRDALDNLSVSDTLTKADEGKFIACSGTITISLPDLDATDDVGFFIRFVKSGAAGTVTIDPHGSGTINGAANYQLTDDLESVYLKYNGDSGGNNLWAVAARSKDTDTKATVVQTISNLGTTYTNIGSPVSDTDIISISVKGTLSGNAIHDGDIFCGRCYRDFYRMDTG